MVAEGDGGKALKVSAESSEAAAGERLAGGVISDQPRSSPLQMGDAGLAAAIAALAKAMNAKGEEPSGSPFRKALTSGLAGLLPTLIMFVLGFILIQSVELNLKREEFTANSADKLRDYVEALLVPKTEGGPEMALTRAKATALALGGFGGPSVLPLVSIIGQGGDEQRMAAAKLGLEQAGRVAPETACRGMASVIEDPTESYDWKVQKTVLEVAGLVGCSEARIPAGTFRSRIAGLAGLDGAQRDEAYKEIDTALKRIDTAEQRRAPWWAWW